MTYASASRRPNAPALAGALTIPGAVGALLIVGLAVTVTPNPPRPNPTATPIAEVPLPPPPTPVDEKPRAETKNTTTTTPVIDRPVTPIPPINPPIIFDGPIDLGPKTPVTEGPIVIGTPGTSATPASLYDPVGAKAKGNPGNWVTNDDYRPRWIQEELSGTARFTLQIDARGKVTGCSITRSTGHAALDIATCDLVSKRARFDAARDSNGKPVAGTWSSSVTWRIPE